MSMSTESREGVSASLETVSFRLAGDQNPLILVPVYLNGNGVGAFLAMLSEAVGTKLDGIVGYNFLNQFRVTIAYPQGSSNCYPQVLRNSKSTPPCVGMRD